MTLEQFWNQLLDSGDLILSTDEPLLGNLAPALRDAADDDGLLVVEGVHAEFDPVAHMISVQGRCSLPGSQQMTVKGQFAFSDAGELLSFYFRNSAADMDQWTLPQAWTALPKRKDAFYAKSGQATVFNGTARLVRPRYVISAGRPEIVIAGRKHRLDDGLHVIADSLEAELPSKPRYLEAIRDDLPADFLSAITGKPKIVKARLGLRDPRPFLVLDCWWDPPALGSQWPPEECAWLATANEVGLRLLHQSDVRVEAIAEFGFGPVASAIVDKRLIFSGEMEPPAPLDGGITDMLALTRTPGLTPPRAPWALGAISVLRLRLERLAVAPGTASAAVVMLDADGKPVSIDMFDGFLQIRNLGYLMSFDGTPEAPVVGVTWTGTTKIGDFAFDVSFSANRFEATLDSPREVDPLRAVTAFLGGAGPDLPSFPFTLQSVEFSGDKAADHSIDYRFGVNLTGELDLTAGAKALVLREAGMSIERSTRKDSGTTVRMGGVATVGGAELSMWGSRTSGGKGDKGWEFEGRLELGDGISMTALADDLLHKWGSGLPAFVPEIDLKALSIGYSTFSKSLRIAASTTFQIPGDVPWALGGPHDAGFELTSAHPPGKGRSTELSLTWSHPVKSAKGDYRFDGFLFASKESQNFVLDFDGTGQDGKGNTTVGLADLTSMLNLGTDLPFGADKWAIFNFNRVTIGFDRAGKKKSFFLSASTRLKDDVDLEINASLGGKSPMFGLKWDPPADKPDATIGLGDVFTAFGLTVPTGGDILGSIAGKFLDIFTFRSLMVRYSHRPQPTLVFMARSACIGYGELMIGTARGKDGSWGQVLCLTFPPESTLLSLFDAYRIPGIEQLLDMIHPEWVMISTVDRFDLPEGEGTLSRGAVTPPPFVDSAGKKSTPFGTSRMKIRKGFSVAGYVDFTNSQNEVAKTIHEHFHLDVIRGRVCVNTDGVEFEAMLSGGIDKKTGKALPGGFTLSTGKSFDLTLRDASIALLVERGLVGGSVRGACQVNLFGVQGSYELDLTVSTSGVDGRLHVISSPKLPEPLPPVVPNPKLSVPALPGVTFHDDYWLDVGIVFEPPGFKFGISSDFHIGADPDQYKGHVDIVLDLEGPVPNPIYLAARIDKLDLWAMFEAQYAVGKRLDQARKGVDIVLGKDNRLSATFEELQHHWENLQKIASILTLRDASFHWCETVVPLPDGTVAQPGVGFQGTLDIAGWTAYGMFEFSSKPFSLMADLDLSPLRLQNVLSITGDGKGITRNGKVMVEPGGPVFHVDSGKSPYLHANLHVSLFEVLNLDVLADVTNEGFEFHLQANAGEVANLDLGCFLKTRGGVHFQSHGTFRLHVNLDLDPAKYLGLPEGMLGTFHFDAGLDAHFTLDLTPATFSFVVGGSFDFEGATLTMPELTITVPFGDLKDLAVQIVSHIKDKALEIFSEIWDVLKKGFQIVGEFVVHTAQVAYEEAKKIVGAVADEAKEVYHKLEEGAKQLVGAVAEKAEAVCREVSEAVDKLATEAIDGAKELGRKALEQAGKLLEAAEQAFSAAVDTAKKIAGAIAEEVSKIAGEIAHAVEEAARKIAELAAEAARFAKHLVDGAIELAKAIAREAEEIVAGIEHAIGALWDEINALIRRAAEAVRDAALAVAHGVEDVVHAIGSC